VADINKDRGQYRCHGNRERRNRYPGAHQLGQRAERRQKK
jgi:hypothetical protein